MMKVRHLYRITFSHFFFCPLALSFVAQAQQEPQISLMRRGDGSVHYFSYQDAKCVRKEENEQDSDQGYIRGTILYNGLETNPAFTGFGYTTPSNEYYGVCQYGVSVPVYKDVGDGLPQQPFVHTFLGTCVECSNGVVGCSTDGTCATLIIPNTNLQQPSFTTGINQTVGGWEVPSELSGNVTLIEVPTTFSSSSSSSSLSVIGIVTIVVVIIIAAIICVAIIAAVIVMIVILKRRQKQSNNASKLETKADEASEQQDKEGVENKV